MFSSFLCTTYILCCRTLSRDELLGTLKLCSQVLEEESLPELKLVAQRLSQSQAKFENIEGTVCLQIAACDIKCQSPYGALKILKTLNLIGPNSRPSNL